MRVVVVTPIPTPYRDPCWESFSRQGVELTVIYCAAGKADRPWGQDDAGYSYRREFPKGRNLLAWSGWGSACYWNRAAIDRLKEAKPDIVLIGGYNHITMLLAARYCNRNGIPWLLMCESWKQRTGVRGALKKQLLSRWLRGAAGILPTGKRAAANGERLGFALDKQCKFPNVPDIEALRTLSGQLQKTKTDIQAGYGIPSGHKVLLFAARMIPKKRPLLIIEAFSRLQDESSSLVMIGDGPLYADAKKLAESLGCQDRVVFPGFLSPPEVHRWMSMADVFLQPSRETWGVAPIEALACGTPVVLSTEIGCVDDVLVDPSLGRVLTSSSTQELADLLKELLDSLPGYGHVVDQFRMWADENSFESLSRRLKEFLTKTIAAGELV